MIDQSLAGKELIEFVFPVVATKIKEFASALKNPNPLYINKQAAKNAGFIDVLMPITFPVTFPFHIEMQDAIMDTMKILGMNERSSVHGEVTFTYHRTIHAGEKLKAVMQIGNIYQKDGKSGGKMTFVEITFNYYDEQEALVCEVVNLFIEKS